MLFLSKNNFFKLLFSVVFVMLFGMTQSFAQQSEELNTTEFMNSANVYDNNQMVDLLSGKKVVYKQLDNEGRMSDTFLYFEKDSDSGGIFKAYFHTHSTKGKWWITKKGKLAREYEDKNVWAKDVVYHNIVEKNGEYFFVGTKRVIPFKVK